MRFNGIYSWFMIAKLLHKTPISLCIAIQLLHPAYGSYMVAMVDPGKRWGVTLGAFLVDGIIQGGAPKIAKLAHITPISLWFKGDISIVNGVYKQIYNWWGTTL